MLLGMELFLLVRHTHTLLLEQKWTQARVHTSAVVLVENWWRVSSKAWWGWIQQGQGGGTTSAWLPDHG